ncbi:MAG TPA: hypothetical protein PLL10_02760 [Elusimicrobiales bacterium]|nr:hypothetical protein [Elusimicrobiales bacterium]
MSRQLTPETAAAEIAALGSTPEEGGKHRFHVIFLAGSGLSEPAVPSCRSLAQACARLCGADPAAQSETDATPAQQLAYWLGRSHADPAERRVYLRSLFEGRPLTASWVKLARLLVSRRLSSAVITTCFDDFAARALDLFQAEYSLCDTILAIPRFQPDAESVLQVFQIHGNVAEYDPARFAPRARDDYREAVCAKIASTVSGRVPVIMGYSGLEQDAIMLALQERLPLLEKGFYWYCHSRSAYDALPDWLKAAPQAAFIVPPEPELLKRRLDAVLGADADFVSRGLFGAKVEAFYSLECIERALNLEAPLLASNPAAFFLERMEEQVSSSLAPQEDVYFLQESVERLRGLLSAHHEPGTKDKLLNLMRSARYEEAVELVSRESKSAPKEQRKALAEATYVCLQRLGAVPQAQL